MRRLLLIFMLLFFPLQVSLAAVCVYCQEQCVFEQDGQSETKPQSKADDVTKARAALSMDADCHCCHVGGASVPAQLALALPVKAQVAVPVLTIQDFYSATRSERPERPKWTRAS